MSEGEGERDGIGTIPALIDLTHTLSSLYNKALFVAVFYLYLKRGKGGGGGEINTCRGLAIREEKDTHMSFEIHADK